MAGTCSEENDLLLEPTQEEVSVGAAENYQLVLCLLCMLILDLREDLANSYRKSKTPSTDNFLDLYISN